MFVQILFNISLLFALVVAPVFFAMSLWYRKNVGKAAMLWPMPEMVVVTIVTFVLSLLLMIVGVSCLFSYWGLFESGGQIVKAHESFFRVGISSFLFLFGIGLVYLGLRKMMLQFVLDRGILFYERFFPFPAQTSLIGWENVIDFFQQTDYPNVVFQLIIDNQNLRFNRLTLRVPIYLKEEFLHYMEKKIAGARASYKEDSAKSKAHFPEN